MSFYYNATWTPSRSLSGVEIASGGPYDASDFTSDQLLNAQRAFYGLKALWMVPNVIRNASVHAASAASKIDTATDRLNAKKLDASGEVSSMFDVAGSDSDPDKIYNDYGVLYDFAEKSSKVGQLYTAALGEWKKMMGNYPSVTPFDSLDELADSLSQAYEDYFNAYYDESAGAQVAAVTSPTATTQQVAETAVAQNVQASPSATGKPRKAAIRKPTPKRAGMSPVVIAALLGGGALVAWWIVKR